MTVQSIRAGIVVKGCATILMVIYLWARIVMERDTAILIVLEIGVGIAIEDRRPILASARRILAGIIVAG